MCNWILKIISDVIRKSASLAHGIQQARRDRTSFKSKKYYQFTKIEGNEDFFFIDECEASCQQPRRVHKVPKKLMT